MHPHKKHTAPIPGLEPELVGLLPAIGLPIVGVTTEAQPAMRCAVTKIYVALRFEVLSVQKLVYKPRSWDISLCHNKMP